LRWQMLELYDMPSELAGFVGQGTLSGGIDAPDERIEQLMQVTVERVRDAAARIFQAQTSTLVVIGRQNRTAQKRLQMLQQRLGA